MSELDSQRGVKEAAAFLEKKMPIDEVSNEVVQEGKQLLTEVGQMASNREFSDENIQEFLREVILDSSFDGARVELRQYEKFGVAECHENMMVQLGKQPGSYTVWFERDNGGWVLACHKIPAGGNLRSA